MTKVIICGVAGRMGKRLATLAEEDGGIKLVGGTEHSDNPAVGGDIGNLIGKGELGVNVCSNLQEVVKKGDVVVDFSTPEATLNNTKICGTWKKPIVVGTTGFSEEQAKKLNGNVSGIPSVISPNFSAGMNLLFELAKQATKALGEDFNVEIIESHHKFKKDAPSGTAEKLAEVVADGLSWNVSDVAKYGRKGRTGPRNQREIGIHSIRAGDILGEHTLLFGGIGERIELSHKVSSRDAFAMGALKAAKFVSKAKPGLYSMADVLGLKKGVGIWKKL